MNDHVGNLKREKNENPEAYRIKITWDDEAHVWIAVSEDLEGLVLEGGSLDALIERARVAAPELLEIQGAQQKVQSSPSFVHPQNFP